MGMTKDLLMSDLQQAFDEQHGRMLHNAVKIDVDGYTFPLMEWLLAYRLRARAWLLRERGVFLQIDSVKRTRRGWHLVFLTPSRFLDDKELVFIQLVMMSDWKREVFNFSRILRGMRMSSMNVLFEKKYKLGVRNLTLLSQEREDWQCASFRTAWDVVGGTNE